MWTFFQKKYFNATKVETLKMARYIQILNLSTLNIINQRNVSHIKLSKYCNIDARLTIYYKNIDYSYTPGYTLAMCYFAQREIFENML